MIGGTIVSNARLMKPLFYDGNFNRDGKKMRAVFERDDIFVDPFLDFFIDVGNIHSYCEFQFLTIY